MANHNDRTLSAYLPPVLSDVREFQALMEGEQPEIVRLFARIEDALNDQFVPTATEYGVERWERLLGLVPKATATLQERKFTILSRLAEELPYTERRLSEMLQKLCGEKGYTMVIDGGKQTLIVRVALTAKPNFEDVKTLLTRVVPAQLMIDLSLLYNQHHQLFGLSHGFLTKWTQDQLRNEGLQS